MDRQREESIQTFISITGASKTLASQKLEEHGGDLNAAINAYFNEGDTNTTRDIPCTTTQDDPMDIDCSVDLSSQRSPLSLLAGTGFVNPFSLLDQHLSNSLFSGSGMTRGEPLISHPKEVREIPIEVKDGGQTASHSGRAPLIEDVTETDTSHGPEVRGSVIIDDEDGEEDYVTLDHRAKDVQQQELSDRAPSHSNNWQHPSPSAPEVNNMPDSSNDIEEAMIQAAIQASKLECQDARQEKPLPKPHATSKAHRASDFDEVELMEPVSSNERSEAGNTSGRKRIVIEDTPSSPEQCDENHEIGASQNGNDSHTDEWGGMSTEEQDEAMMLEAAMFGGVSHDFIQNHSFPERPPRPSSPSLHAQRLIREQQDDEYLASLAADVEKEMKATEEAKARLLQEEATRISRAEEERRQQEESRIKFEKEQEIERLIAAKEASLPREPQSDNENAITLLVRLPDGTRQGRCFLKSDKLKHLFDFIDTCKVVRPGSYRLVRSYPRQTFGDGEAESTLSDLGLTSKQEALYLELI